MGRKNLYMIILKVFNWKKKILYEGHGRLARWIKWKTSDVREAKEGLENELWRRWSNGSKAHSPTFPLLHLRHNSFSNPFVALPTSQLISPTLPLLHLRHCSLSNPSFASPTSQALHLCHLASRPWFRCNSVLKIWVVCNSGRSSGNLFGLDFIFSA